MPRGRAIGGMAVACWSMFAFAQSVTPPDTFVDEGACPFECCAYGRWTASAEIPVLAQAAEDATRIATLAPGDVVDALDGHVRTRGVPFTYTRAHGEAKAGDVRMVYTYLGEGIFRTWRDGRWEEEDLGFSPGGGTAGPRCNAPECFGRLERALVSAWWVQMRLPDGRTGWVDGHAGFKGNDGCAE